MGLLDLLSGIADLCLAIGDVLASWRFYLCLALGALVAAGAVWLMPNSHWFISGPAVVAGLVAGVWWEVVAEPE